MLEIPRLHAINARQLIAGLACLFSITACSTTSETLRTQAEWTRVQTPDELGALSFPLCWASGHLIHIVGGINEDEEGPFNTQGYSYNVSERSWLKWESNPQPPPKQNFAFASLPDGFLIFGGAEEQAPEGTHDAHLYSYAKGSWQRLAGSERLDPRSHASATTVGSQILIYGGKGKKPILNAGLYDGLTQTWEVLLPPADLGTRISHAAVGLEDKVFLWGGFKDSTRQGDGYIFDPRTKVWTSIKASPLIGARANVRALVDGAKVFLLGGSPQANDESLGAVYDTDSQEWTPIPEIEDGLFKDIKGFEAILIARSGILIRGGRSPANIFNDEEYFLDFSTNRWEKLSLRNAPPGTLGGCLGSVDDHSIYTLGGIHRVPGQGLRHLRSLWILTLP